MALICLFVAIKANRRLLRGPLVKGIQSKRKIFFTSCCFKMRLVLPYSVHFDWRLTWLLFFSIITRPVKNQVNWTWGCCRVVGSLSELRRLKTNRKMSKRRRKVIKNEWHLLITTTFAWPAEKKLSHFLIFLIFAYSSLTGLLANTPGFDGHLVVGLKGFNCNISQFFVILYRFPSYNRSRWR